MFKKTNSYFEALVQIDNYFYIVHNNYTYEEAHVSFVQGVVSLERELGCTVKVLEMVITSDFMLPGPHSYYTMEEYNARRENKVDSFIHAATKQFIEFVPIVHVTVVFTENEVEYKLEGTDVSALMREIDKIKNWKGSTPLPATGQEIL